MTMVKLGHIPMMKIVERSAISLGAGSDLGPAL
jgi:hypothetical protein